MKRIVSVLLLMILLFTVPVFAEEPIRVYLDEEEISFDVSPQIINDRAMVPMRAIFEALGATVEFKPESRAIFAHLEDIEVVLEIDQPEMYVSGQIIELDVAPVIVQDRTLVPIRAVSVAFLCNVVWNVENRTIYITRPENVLTKISAKPRMQIDFTGKEDLRSDFHREVRMLFEREYLPMALYQDQELSALYFLYNPEALLEAIDKRVWNYCVMGVTQNYLMNTLPEFELMTTTELLDQIEIMFDRYSLRPYQVYDYDTFMLKEQVYCVLMNLADISEAKRAEKYANCTQSTQIAMTYDANANTFGYYLLEQQTDGSYALCSIDANMEHAVIQPMENDKLIFINALIALFETKE